MLLFQDDTTPEAGYTSGVGPENFGYSKYLDEFKYAVKSALDIGYFQSFFTSLEDQAVKTSRSLAGNIKGYSSMIESSMLNVYKQTVMIGGSTKDVISYAESFATQTGRIPAIQEEIIISAIKISKEFGISVKEVAAMAGEFAKIGLGQSKAIDAIRTIGNTARKYGVNASQLTKTVQENLKISAGYTFKDGIKGLTEMAAQAQRLGIKMEGAMSLYKEFLDPDKAIEYASEISLLGGKFAQTFGDPFRNMSMSVEEIQQGFIDAAQASAVFNEKTGEFEIPRAQQQAMMAFTSKMGLDYSEFVSTVKQGAKEMKVLEGTKWQTGIGEEDKKLISSLAQIGTGGEFEVQIPGTKEWLKTSDLTATQIEELKNKMSTEEIKTTTTAGQDAFNEKFLSSAERQNNTLIQIRDALILNADLKQGKSSVDLLTALSEKSTEAIKKITDSLPIPEVLNLLKIVNTTAETYINSPTGLQADMNIIITALRLAVATPPEVKDAFSSPVKGGTFVSGPKGSFLTIPDDEILAAPNISKFVDAALTSFNSLNDLNNSVSLKPTENVKSAKLTEVMSSNVTTTVNTSNTQKMEGGFTITIDASKVPNSLDPTMLKNEIMSAMYKLNDEMKKQGVLNFKI